MWDLILIQLDSKTFKFREGRKRISIRSSENSCQLGLVFYFFIIVSNIYDKEQLCSQNLDKFWRLENFGKCVTA